MISGLPMMRKAACSSGNFQMILIRGRFFLKLSTKGTEDVTYVSHDEDDGAWQFLGDSMADGGGPVISCLHHPIDRDPSLAELADLPQGWYAERAKVGEPWVRRKHEAEEGSEEVAALF